MYLNTDSFRDAKALSPVEAQLILNETAESNPIRGLLIASAMSLPFWAGLAYVVSSFA